MAYVLKYESTLGDYRSAAGGMTRRAAYVRGERTAKTRQISEVRRAPDLQRRCASASRYFGKRPV